MRAFELLWFSHDFSILEAPFFEIQLHRILGAGWDGLEDPDASTDAVGMLHQRYEMAINLQAHASCQVRRAATDLFMGTAFVGVP